jgi:hypothetical protein
MSLIGVELWVKEKDIPIKGLILWIHQKHFKGKRGLIEKSIGSNGQNWRWIYSYLVKCAFS